MSSSSGIKTSSKKQPSLNPNKKIEINMSTLSTAQKQMCIKLLAQSNINFQEAKGKDFFEAELRIDPARLTSEFSVEKETVPVNNAVPKSSEKQTEPNISPIKKRQTLATKLGSTSSNLKPFSKENASSMANTSKCQPVTKQSQNLKPTTTKSPIHPIYTISKKSLAKTVKLNLLSQMQRLHPFVQLYVYPKKMSFQNLTQLIEEIYDIYWNVEINNVQKSGNCNKPAKGRRENDEKQHNFSFDNNPQNNGRFNPSSNQRTNLRNPSPQSIQSSQQPKQQTTKQTFCSWVFSHFILTQKQKMKIEQLLVNLIESLNHFSYKHLGVQLFYNFLSGVYNLEVLHYYLVIRALLEQLQGQRIIEKVSSYGSKAGVMYKMKLNPYVKFIEEEKVLEFLEVCCCQEATHSPKSNNGNSESSTINKIFQEMTEHMFFDEKKKKNFIHFFQMVDVLLKEFLKVETVNTTNLELSYTQENSSMIMNDFLFSDQLNAAMSPNSLNRIEEDLELTFEVHQQEEEEEENATQQQEIHPNNNKSNYYSNTQSDCDLNEYLPNYNSRELQVPPQQQNQRKIQTFEMLLYEKLVKKYESIRKSLSGSTCLQENNQNLQSRQILQTLYVSVVKGDKQKWTELMKESQGNKRKSDRESQELHFIERLQMEFQKIKSSNIVSNDFIRKMLTAPYLRQAIVKETGVSFNEA